MVTWLVVSHVQKLFHANYEQLQERKYHRRHVDLRTLASAASPGNNHAIASERFDNIMSDIRSAIRCLHFVRSATEARSRTRKPAAKRYFPLLFADIRDASRRDATRRDAMRRCQRALSSEIVYHCPQDAGGQATTSAAASANWLALSSLSCCNRRICNSCSCSDPAVATVEK